MAPSMLAHLSSQSGKTGKGGKKADGSARSSRSAKAGLQFPVGRVHRLLKKGNYAQRVGAGAPGMSFASALLLDCVDAPLPRPMIRSKVGRPCVRQVYGHGHLPHLVFVRHRT